MIWKLVKLQQFHFSTFSTTNIDFIDRSIIVNVVSQKIDVLSFNEAKSTKFNVELFCSNTTTLTHNTIKTELNLDQN